MKNVTYVYEDGTVALDNVNIDLNKNKRIGIVGSNGAGKSTMFMNFLGLLKPAEGKIYYGEEELSYNKKSLTELRKNVGIVFQDPDKQIFFSNVYDDIAFALRNLKYDEKEISERVETSMQKTNISHLKNKPVHFLSYGQKKNVSIAGTIAMEQSLIFFDEPTAGLDRDSRENIKDILNNLVEKENKSIVVSSHDMNFIYEVCDYIYVLNKGSVLTEGETREVFLKKEILDEASLEEPFLIKVHKYLNIPLYKTEQELYENKQPSK